MNNLSSLGITLLVLIALCRTANAQISPVVGVDHLITYHKNPFSYLYFRSLYLSDEKRGSIAINLAVDSLLDVSPYDYIRTSQEILRSDQVDTVDLLIYKKSHEKVKILQVLIEKDDYFITCERIVQDICECGSYISFFFPRNQSLINIERPFSFSLRKDFARSLEQQVNVTMDPNEYANLCDMINAFVESGK